MMDFTTLVIDGNYYKAFKDFKATPNASTFTQKDANELKAPVLALSGFGDHYRIYAITEFMNIAVILYLLITGERYVREKKI